MDITFKKNAVWFDPTIPLWLGDINETVVILLGPSIVTLGLLMLLLRNFRLKTLFSKVGFLSLDSIIYFMSAGQGYSGCCQASGNVKIAKNASAKHIDMIGNYYFSVVCLLPIDFSQSLAEISSVAVPVDQNRRKVPLSLPG